MRHHHRRCPSLPPRFAHHPTRPSTSDSPLWATCRGRCNGSGSSRAAHALLRLSVACAAAISAHAQASSLHSFCTGGYNASTGDCVVSTSPNCSAGCEAASSGALRIQPSVTVQCIRPCFVFADGGCQIRLDFASGIFVGEGAKVIGSSVRLTSTAGMVRVGAGATVDASGMGRCGNAGVEFDDSAGAYQYGAGHGGYGGMCNGIGLGGYPFGDGTRPWWKASEGEPDSVLYGAGSSMGKSRECCGGGLVLINGSKGVEIEGSVLADAQQPCHLCNATQKGPRCCPSPDESLTQAQVSAAGAERRIVFRSCHGLSGAAGGTIIVLTSALNGSGAISANGGAGAALSESDPEGLRLGVRLGAGEFYGAGGAGGRVWVPLCPQIGETSGVKLSARGGTSLLGCTNGAAGTVFAHCGTSPQMSVNNFDLPTIAPTCIFAARDTVARVAPPPVQLDVLRILGGAKLTSCRERNGGINVSTASEIVLQDDAQLAVEDSGWVVTSSLRVLLSSSITAKSSLPQATYNLLLDALQVDPLSTIFRLRSAFVSGTAELAGRMSSTEDGRLVLSVGNLEVLSIGAISAPSLDLHAKSATLFGKLQASTRLASAFAEFVPDCVSDDTASMPAHLAAASTPADSWKESAPYPLEIRVASYLIVERGSAIVASSVLVCAAHIQLRGTITAAYLGSPASEGQPGAHGCTSLPSTEEQATLSNSGAGSGGGHGGNGGRSGPVANISGCVGGKAYGNKTAPGMFGSGGGGVGGGSGGGVVHVVATESLSFVQAGWISADGGDGRRGSQSGGFGRSRAVVGAAYGGGGGGGGGSGGSIIVQARQIVTDGTGRVTARGGAAGNAGGGGGGGGRVRVRPTGNASYWSPPLAANLTVVFAVPAGGKAGSGGQMGGDGTLCGADCDPGYGGIFCQPCAPGTFKAEVGDHSCQLCGAGSFGAGSARTSCTFCAPGSAVASKGALRCLPCPGGTFADIAGAERCTPCAHAIPKHSQYRSNGSCEWRCTPPFVSVAGSNSCGLLLELVIQIMGGYWVLFMPVAAAAAALVSIILAARLRRSEERQEPSTRSSLRVSSLASCVDRHGGDASTLSEDVLPRAAPLWTQGQLLSSLESAMAWERHKYRAKQHVQRLYLTGCNSAVQPWSLPLLPRELRSLISESTYYRLAERFRAESQWDAWEMIVHAALHLLPPLAMYFAYSRRLAHCRQLQALIASIDSGKGSDQLQLWRSLHNRVWEGHRLELHCCAQLRLGWIDVFTNLSAPRLAGGVSAQRQLPRMGLGRGAAGASVERRISQGDPEALAQFGAQTRSCPTSDGHGGSGDDGFGFPGAVRRSGGIGGGHSWGKALSSFFRQRPASPRGNRPFLQPSAQSAAIRPPELLSIAPAASNCVSQRLEPLLMPISPPTTICQEALSWAGSSDLILSPTSESPQSPEETADVTLSLSPSDGSEHLQAPTQLRSPLLDTPTAHGDPEVEEHRHHRRGAEPRLASPVRYGREGGGGPNSGVDPLVDGAAPSDVVKTRDYDDLPSESPQGQVRATLLARVDDRRVVYRIYLCGEGTCLSPFWLELGDFLAFAALNAVVEEAAEAVAECLNIRLRSLDRWSRGWRQSLLAVLRLIDAINKQISAATKPSEKPWALALVHFPSQERQKQLALLAGVGGRPKDWHMPPGGTLLCTRSCTPDLRLQGFSAPPVLLELPKRLLLGATEPVPLPWAAAATLLVLVLDEAVVLTVLLGSLCVYPDAAAFATCITALSAFPLASVMSPLVTLSCLLRASIVFIASPSRRRAGSVRIANTTSLLTMNESEGSSSQHASADALSRVLRICLGWNACSMVNAAVLIAAFCFSRVNRLFHPHHVLLPVCLMGIKILLAQAIKELASSAGITDKLWKLLTALERAL